ncbi:Sec-independent protein translocase protein TatC [Desulfuromonas versatilis]|uniref:Sec-independent protein translocase protein TatC n=1 Tax=Desulfuromonas versatilis TaxID=2802975 RepID=A0ABM8HT46_9BACT|nr:Sec-independent protein translocase protein TatC [Desulfuromonas versatilis]
MTTHLEELRKRLIIAGGSWLAAFFASYGFAEPMFRWVAGPVRAALPAQGSLVFLTATEPFFTYLKLAALAGLLAALPVILWQLWLFVAPGLYAHEKRLGLTFVVSGCCCFGAGAYFGFRYVFPTIFAVLIRFGLGAGGVTPMLSMDAYLGLAIKMLLAFGVVFELPVVISLLARMGVVDPPWLRRNRKYMLIVAFVFGALVTPGPDVISQCSVAIPFVLLYEVGILGARIFGRTRQVPGAGSAGPEQASIATGA